MRSFTYVAILTLSLLSGGCDLLAPEPDGTIVVTGTVVLAETGEPIEGLSVALKDSGSFGLYFVRATALTQADGTFYLTHDAGPHGTLHAVRVNEEPYDPRYTGFGTSARPGEQTDLGVIELEGNEAP